ncbi:MAG: hypothetical protein M5U26_30230 [Planctomycetota bacterium]|nr:hypothetical protein [Planctomycetota bacterium]
MKGWAAGLAVAVVCALLGGLLGALTLNPDDLRIQPFLWGALASLLPSALAGFMAARGVLGRSNGSIEGLDQLTGLFGEERLRQDLEVEWSRSKRVGKKVGVVIAELDQGERFAIPQYVAWRAMARTLKQATRISDSAYVLGPGRFAVLLSATETQGGDVVIKRLRGSVKDVPELYGVKIRYGGHVEDPGDPAEPLAEQVLLGAQEAVRQAQTETTVPKPPEPAEATGTA